MRALELITQALLVAHIAAAAGLHELFLATEIDRSIVISLHTGLCYRSLSLHDGIGRECEELGVSSVFGLKGSFNKQSLPIQDALSLLRADSCPLKHISVSVLVWDESVTKEASKWVEHGVTIQSGWSAAGILQGPDFVPAKLKDLCPGQGAGIGYVRRALQQQQQQQQQPLQQQANTTQQSTNIVAWDPSNLGQATWITDIFVVPMPTELTKPGAVKAISAGHFYTVALLANDSVVAWGLQNNTSPELQLSVPLEVQSAGAAAISAGSFHTLALLKGTGKVVCWGRNQMAVQQCNVPPVAIRGVQAIKATSTSSFAQLADNSWFAWGKRASDWLQSGFFQRKDIVDIIYDPLMYTGLIVRLTNNTLLQYGGTVPLPTYLSHSNVTAVCSGSAFTMAVLSSGSIAGWGYPKFTDAWERVPTDIQGRVKNVVCGPAYVIAQLNNGSMVGWGAYASSRKPLDVGSGILPSNATSFAAGAMHSVYLMADGSVKEDGGYPPQITQLTDISSVAQSSAYSIIMAVRQDGSLVTWGATSHSNWWYVLTPPLFGPNLPVASVAVGDIHAVALLQSGHVVNWGSINATIPFEVQLGGVSAVSAGGSFAMALKAGRVYAWGDDQYRDWYCDLPNTIPAQALANVTQISAGYDHALALLSDGSVVAWGCNELNQTTVPSGVRDAVAIAAGAGFSVALTKSGTLFLWGGGVIIAPYNISMTLQLNQQGLIDLSAGRDTAMVRLPDKTVLSLNVGTGTWDTAANLQHDTIAVSVGYHTNIALVARTPIISPPIPPSPPAPSVLFPPTTLNTSGTVVGWGESIYQHAMLPPANVTAANSVVAIAAGVAHALALHKDGRVTVWGTNDFNQTNVPQAVRQGTVRAIATGWRFSLAIMNDTGKLVCWGDNSDQQCEIPDIVKAGTVQAIKGAGAAAFAKLGDGRWVGWGYGFTAIASSSNLGNNFGMNSVLNIVDIMVNPIEEKSYILLLANGSLVNIASDGTSTAAIAPVAAANITAVCSAGGSYAMAVDSNGYVWSWGTAYHPYAIWYAVPDGVQGKVKSIACGLRHVLVQLNDGSIVTWGKQVPPGKPPSNAKAMAASTGYTLYLLADGNVLQSGGLPGTTDNATVPDGLNDIKAISSQGVTTVALKKDGSVVTWGFMTSLVQQLPSELVNNGAIAISAGRQHALALLPSGVVVQWGNINADVPPEALSGGIKAVAAGYGFSLALTKDGKVIAWSDVTDTSLICSFVISQVPPAAQSNVVEISAGLVHALALLSNGTVIAWGCVSDITSVPANATSGVVAIAAGALHSLAILQSGAVVAWGDDSNNKTRVPTAAMANVIAVSADLDHSAALLSNGSVVTWGSNAFGQLSVPSEVQGRVSAIAAYQTGTFAILQPAPPPGLSPPFLLPSAPPTTLTTDGSQGSSAFSVGKVVGIACGAAAAVLLALTAFILVRRKQGQRAATATLRSETKGTYQPFAADIVGLTPGEVFTRATAHEYTWCEDTGTDAKPLSLSDNDNSAYPPIQLSKEEVQEQLVLVKNGLLGRGATALVFKCKWPSRFGPDALLAAKVLKDGYELDINTLQSFHYEATVLASFNPPHSNVVRLYGYCFEAPTVCLVLELLPGSLKALIYKQPSDHTAKTRSQSGLKKTYTAVSQTGTFFTSTASSSEANETACTTYITVSGTVGMSDVTTNGDGSSTNVAIQQLPNTASLSVTPQLSMLQVLQISIDIAAGLRYLHEMPLVANPDQLTTAPHNLDTVQEFEPVTPSDLQSYPSTSLVTQKTGTPSDLQSTPSAELVATQKTTKVVHRDLKPANILIAADGTAKISDFGLARQQMNTTMVTESLAAGTLPYMAPELLVSARVGSAAIPATNRVDIYSMAMIMWEMLAGRVPWSHMSEPALLAAVMSGRRPELPHTEQVGPITQPLSEIPASVNALPEFNAIIRACWNQREHRRPTAAALHDMLLKLLEKYQQ